MPRPDLRNSRSNDLTAQEALNAMVKGIAAARTTDLFTNDAKGTTLALSVTNASKAVPATARAATFWCSSAFRWRLNTAADTTDGAYANANDIVTVVLDPDDIAPVTTLQAVLPSGTATLYINWAFGT